MSARATGLHRSVNTSPEISITWPATPGSIKSARSGEFGLK
jgi:hypothetical protein